MIEIISENLCIELKEDAITELAFAHYPVTVKILDNIATFDCFDKARIFVEESEVK